MTLPDRIATALAAILEGANLPGSPSITQGINLEVNEEESARVIVVAQTAQLRKESLPGIYDVSGEVTVWKTIDTQEDATETLKSDFDELTRHIENIVGQKYFMPLKLQTQDSCVKAYSWNLTGQDSFMQSRAMGARFTWTCFARHEPHNPN